MTEFELIDLFVRRAPRAGEGVLLGIGDDAAVLRPPSGHELVMTVDAVVEGVHFDRRFSPEDVGYKALAVNLSDLAAMGARPLWALCALATPAGEKASRLARVGEGLAACAREHAIALVGGNVTRARDLSLTVTAVGAVRKSRLLTRAGGEPGDLLLVSGSLGDAAAGRLAKAPPALARRQRRPEPRLALGEALAPLAHAGLDLSDGLLQDLGHLCTAAGLGAVVRLALLPLSAAYRRATSKSPRPFDAALAGGEDYELLFAVPPERVGEAQTRARKVGVPLTAVGELTREHTVRVLDAQGKKYPIRTRGHDHLRARGG
ncbi:MAG TPA: thiamine-phosphate kinase [Anaeromyxobacteraceae bacterium]|nr:thiamine-phosphate kinase [Anaeromyxobacteraceae bacterium]